MATITTKTGAPLPANCASFVGQFLGHKIRTRERQGFRRPTAEARARLDVVALEVLEQRTSCVRCGHLVEVRERTKGIQSLTMSTDRMRVLEDAGEVWL